MLVRSGDGTGTVCQEGGVARDAPCSLLACGTMTLDQAGRMMEFCLACRPKPYVQVMFKTQTLRLPEFGLAINHGGCAWPSAPLD